MDSTVSTTPRQSQPSSFPFLLLTALLFYFFSKSPGTPDTLARTELERTLHRRWQEVVGLKHWLNSSADTHFASSRSASGSNFTEEPIVPAIAYLPSQTFGQKNVAEGRQFVLAWLRDVERRAHIKTPPLYWNNITGHIRGGWSAREESWDWYPPSTPTAGASNSSEAIATSGAVGSSVLYESQRGRFPWTSSRRPDPSRKPKKSWWRDYPSQQINLNLKEVPASLVRRNATMLRGSLYLSAPGFNKDVALAVEGIHFQNNGTFYLRAGPSGSYLDTRLHLSSALDVPASYSQQPVANNSALGTHKPTAEQKHIGEVVICDVMERIRRVQAMLDKGDVPHEGDKHEDAESGAVANCTFLIYAHLTPVPTTSSQTAETLLEYENSLTAPTGASVYPPAPAFPLFQSIMISPNCGLILETDEMHVLLAPKFWAKGDMYGYIAGFVMGVQCWLLVWQMDGRQSPSSLSRMSYLALVAQIIMDAWTFSSHLTLSVVTSNLSSQSLLIPAFFACLNAILFGMRYGTLIRMHPPPASPNNSDLSSRDDAMGHDADYVQVPTADDQSPAIENPPSDLQTTPSSPSLFRRMARWLARLFAGRPILFFAGFIFLLFMAVFLWTRWQSLILALLYSYWVPQIVHNVQNGTSRRGLRKRYVLGTTLCRLFIPLYVWGCPDNVLFLEPNPWIWLLCLYSVLQATFLVLQDYLGARFFLVGGCFSYEPMWDYHPVKLPQLCDLENGQSGAALKMPECVICFEPIDVLPSSPTSGNEERPSRAAEVSLFSRWSYMVPPCHHIAHTKCLESWLAIKSECPVCRRALPPI